jgi:hypothetical protein
MKQLAMENQSFKNEVKLLATPELSKEFNNFVKIQSSNTQKQKEDSKDSRKEIQNMLRHGNENLYCSTSESSTSASDAIQESQLRRGQDEIRSSEDSRILKALSELVAVNGSNNHSNNSSESALYRNSAPTEFEPRTAFQNYQWFITLESSLKYDHGSSLSKKLELLKRLVVRNTNGWLQFDEELTRFKTWKAVREEFFIKFVTTKKEARRAFEEKMIEEGESPEHFLYDLRLLADVSGVVNEADYKIILRNRFLYGLQNAAVYQFYYLHKDMFCDVDAVLDQLRISGRLNSHNINELKTKKGEEFYLTKDIIGFDNPKKSQKKNTPFPFHNSKIDQDKKSGKKPTTLLLGGENFSEEGVDFIISDPDTISEEELINLHLQQRPPCESCGGKHSSQLCFKNKECPHCKVVGHNLINCFQLCKCRFLLSFNKQLKGVPHAKEEVCPIDWSTLLKSMQVNGSEDSKN